MTIDPDVLAMIEAVAENLPNRDAQVIPLPKRDEDAPRSLGFLEDPAVRLGRFAGVPASGT